VKNTQLQSEKRALGSTNTCRQMGLSLKFLVNYQLKWLEQREKEEKKMAVQFLRL
jgi:hypothetical protein